MKNFVITIARGYGSGGRVIGRELSKRLGIPCYDDQILKMASELSGINKNKFVEVDERLRGSSFLRKLSGIPSAIGWFGFIVQMRSLAPSRHLRLQYVPRSLRKIFEWCPE